jgi:hypothetical protein
VWYRRFRIWLTGLPEGEVGKNTNAPTTRDDRVPDLSNQRRQTITCQLINDWVSP